MSNEIRYDPLLVQYLARELDQRLRGRACAAAPLFAAERVALLPLEGGEALRLDLHPRRGWARVVAHATEPDELDAVCEGVDAPADERVLVVRLRTTERFRALTRRLVVELHSNQWNALLVNAEDQRILSVLWSRTAGPRALRAGAEYAPPAGSPRFGAGGVTEAEARERWHERLDASSPEERRQRLLRHFAYTGTVNADAVLGEAAGGGRGELVAAFARWWWLRGLPPADPVLLHLGARLQPYPLPLPGVEHEPAPSLLAAMERVAERAAELAPAPSAPGLAAIRKRLGAAQRRLERLTAQLERTGEAERMRLWGDLLLARKRLVPRGVESVRLQDWTGKLVEVKLDPTRSATENADHWYEEARKRERADARLPEMLAAAEEEAERWRAALAAAEQGDAPAWAVEAIVGGRESAAGTAPAEEQTLPYRRYRTSGGLEVRVGRNARDNDALTFGHSRPDDVWLHARSVPGSHVILRWKSADGGAPPARDLAEAAGLAALFSKARSSSLVAVDWTRRKYVRKPRGAAPGAVIPQQVRTLFVEPDPELEERLRAD